MTQTARVPFRVLIVVSNLEFGGAQRQIVELVNAVDPAECEIHVCSLSTFVPLGEQLRDRSRLHVIEKRAKFDFGVVLKLARLARRLRIDVMHGYLFDAEIAVNLAGRLARVKAVLGSERNTAYELRRVHRLAHAATRRCVDLVVANSAAGAQFSARVRGHDPRIYRVVRNGVDLGRFRPVDAGRVREELGWTHGERIVGVFASLKQQKNHPLLLRAAAAVRERVPALRLMLVGDILYGGQDGSDEYGRQVRALVEQLGLADITRFLGNRKDLPELYGACALTVLPSFFEGTPNVLLESMACGVPVIATDVADNRLIAPDGQVGRIVPSDDVPAMTAALLQLLEDEDLRAACGRRARQWAEQEFATPVLAARTLAVYREALGLATGSAPKTAS